MCVLFVGNFKIIIVNNTKVPILMVTCIMFDVFNNVKFPRKNGTEREKRGITCGLCQYLSVATCFHIPSVQS